MVRLKYLLGALTRKRMFTVRVDMGGGKLKLVRVDYLRGGIF